MKKWDFQGSINHVRLTVAFTVRRWSSWCWWSSFPQYSDKSFCCSSTLSAPNTALLPFPTSYAIRSIGVTEENLTFIFHWLQAARSILSSLSLQSFSSTSSLVEKNVTIRNCTISFTQTLKFCFVFLAKSLRGGATVNHRPPSLLSIL